MPANRLILYSYHCIILLALFSCGISNEPQIPLTNEESSWLKEKESLVFTIDKDYPPYSYFNEEGQLVGLNVDFIRLIEEKLGISVILVESKWDEALDRAMNHEVDGVINATPLEKRKAKLNFTINFMESARAMVVKHGNSKLLNQKELHLRTVVAAIKGSVHSAWLKDEHPQYEIIEVHTLQDAFEALIFDKVDMIFDDLVPLNFHISAMNLDGIKVVSVKFEGPRDGIGLRNDDDLLLSVMNKAINAISGGEMAAIKKKWIFISEKEDHTLLYGFSIILIILVVAFMILNWSLRNSIKVKSKEFEEESRERKKLQQQLAKGQQKLIALIKNGAFELSLAKDLLKEANDDLLEGKMGLNQTLDFLSKMGKEVRISDKKAQLYQLNRELIQNKIINLLHVVKDGLKVFLFELKSASVDKAIVQNLIIDIVEESIEKAIITADSSQHFEISLIAQKKYDLHEILDKSLIGLDREYGASLDVIKFYSIVRMEVIGDINKLCRVFKTFVFKVAESLGQVKIRTSFDKNEFRVEISNDLFTEDHKSLSFQSSTTSDLTVPLSQEDRLDIHIAILIVKEHQGTIDFIFENKDLTYVLIKFPRVE